MGRGGEEEKMRVEASLTTSGLLPLTKRQKKKRKMRTGEAEAPST
jgi:hypothetical protein